MQKYRGKTVKQNRHGHLDNIVTKMNDDVSGILQENVRRKGAGEQGNNEDQAEFHSCGSASVVVSIAPAASVISLNAVC